MWEDPIINEVRTVRKNLEAKFNFETKAIFKDIRKRQTNLGSRLVCRKKNMADQKTAPNRDSAMLHPGR